MGKTATSWALASCAGVILLTALVVSTLGQSSSPPGAAGGNRAATDLDLGPARATATVSLAGFGGAPDNHASPMYAATPSSETALRGREVLAPQRSVVIAVGNNARSMCDRALETGFASQVTDLDVSFAGCTDRDAVELRMVNRVDMTLIGGSLSARERRAGLRQTRIGLELFALAVAADFPLRSVSQSQMRQLLTGEVRDWQQLGCDRGAVVVVVPSQQPLANRAARKMILGDKFTAGAIRVADDRHVVDQILRNPGAIAVVRTKATPLAGLKLLQIDWTPPTQDAFGYGTYPYGMPLHVVTSGQHEEVVRRFLDYATSEDGRELLGRTLLLP